MRVHVHDINGDIPNVDERLPTCEEFFMYAVFVDGGWLCTDKNLVIDLSFAMAMWLESFVWV